MYPPPSGNFTVCTEGAILGGEDGVFYSGKNGDSGSWFRSEFGPLMANIGLLGPGNLNSHAAGRVNGLEGAAYIVAPVAPAARNRPNNRLRDLWRSADGGKTWVLRRNDAPVQDSDGCGGIAAKRELFGPSQR